MLISSASIDTRGGSVEDRAGSMEPDASLIAGERP
jgi:hypothetical protein